VARNAQGPGGPRGSREADQQCLIRDANEAIERLNASRPSDLVRLALRCECGDPECLEGIAPSHAEYEAVRAYGSRFIVHPNHENPETAAVVHEGVRFSVVEVVAREARHQALARYLRHMWVEGVDPDDVKIGPPSPSERSTS
jgi:hypothetical protein